MSNEIEEEEAKGLRQDSLEVTASDIRKLKLIDSLLLSTRDSPLRTHN